MRRRHPHARPMVRSTVLKSKCAAVEAVSFAPGVNRDIRRRRGCAGWCELQNGLSLLIRGGNGRILLKNSSKRWVDLAMMRHRQDAQPAIFYEFSLENHVPQNHRWRSMDRFVELTEIRAFFAYFHGHTGRLSADHALLIGMLLVGYFFICSRRERLLRTLKILC